jgi:hypothetical protein
MTEEILPSIFSGVHRDGSKMLKPDLPASCTDSLFREPPESAKAEEETVGVRSLNFRFVW